MTVAASATQPAPAPQIRQRPDRRRHQRAEITLGGRFLYDGTDHTFVTLDVSCGGAQVRSAALPEPGTPVIAYFDDLGRIAGKVVRQVEGGFAMAFEVTAHKRDKLADRLVWLVNKKRYNLKDERGAPRKAGGGPALITRADGRKIQCRVLDISLTGAAFEVSGPCPPIGEVVRVGRIRGEVVRAVPEGFAIRFLHRAKGE
ncbi:MAG: PilZ domain-containing protein [Pseudomonadota bacterium]